MTFDENASHFGQSGTVPVRYLIVPSHVSAFGFEHRHGMILFVA